MRIFVTIIISMVLIFSAGIWVNNSLQTSSDHLCSQIETITQHIKSEDWEQAKENTAIFASKWREQAKWWPIILDHQEMDNVEFSLAKVKEFVKEEDKTLALGQLAEIKLMIKHLPEKERLNIKNIL